MTLKPLLIYNPTADKGNAGKRLPKVLSLLAERAFDCDLVLTEAVGHAQLLGQQAGEQGRGLVIAAGGDGTVNETINGLMGAGVNGNRRPALGVLPVGRGNDFSFGVGIPHQIEKACDALVQNQRRRIDIGQVTGGDYPDGRYFGNGVGLGFDTVVGFEAARFKWLKGEASYLAAVVKTIFLYAKAPTYEVVIDHEIIRQPFLMVSIMNGQRMGGAFLMAPDGHPGDGSFDLCLTGDVKQIRILPLAATFISGKQKNNPAIRMLRGRQVSIRAIDGSIPAHADGETLCTAGQQLSIRILPGALDVITGANGTAS
ncbi:MAG TPA: diacylglycerol kinase family protein [Levilinea sp.]|nr:diacylglycerol kinase family protein [Levilinea sp.]